SPANAFSRSRGSGTDSVAAEPRHHAKAMKKITRRKLSSHAVVFDTPAAGLSRLGVRMGQPHRVPRPAALARLHCSYLGAVPFDRCRSKRIAGTGPAQFATATQSASPCGPGTQGG